MYYKVIKKYNKSMCIKFQIYTLTVLNGTEPWLRIDNTPDQPTPALDFDSMLGNNFPGYIKTEYTYDDSGFATDNKDDMLGQQQAVTLTNGDLNCVSLANFQNNNNNDWQMVDHNASEQVGVSTRLEK